MLRNSLIPGMFASLFMMALLQVSPAQAGFAPTASFPAGDGPRSVAAADLNSDSKPDLAVANIYSDDISVLTGKGEGNFNAKVNFPVGDKPASAAIADLGGDDRRDLVVVNLGSNNISILTGNGDGSFNAKVDYPAGNSPDLVVAIYNSGSISILTGKGDGSFNAKVDYPAGSEPFSVAITDLNSDSEADLATTNLSFDSVSILLNQAATATASPSPLAFGNQIQSTKSPTRSIKVTNSAGRDPLNVSSVALSGGYPADFSVVVSIPATHNQIDAHQVAIGNCSVIPHLVSVFGEPKV